MAPKSYRLVWPRIPLVRRRLGAGIKGWSVGPDQKPVCCKPLFNECDEDAMAMITDAGSPSLIWSFLPASFFLV
jgi:hypothetical protein